MGHLIASPCCYPRWTLEQALSTYAELSMSRFEWFTHWVSSALDVTADPAQYLGLADRHGMTYVSGHLPKVAASKPGSFELAVQGARMAAILKTPIVIFGADTLETYVETLPRFMEAVEPLGLTVVLENKRGAAISEVDDYRRVLDAVDDARVRVLLEVGHFHYVGIRWPAAWEALRERVALVHAKDIAGGVCVPFGTGEVGLAEMVATLDSEGYDGDYVMELEGPMRSDEQTVLGHIRQGIEYFRGLGLA